MDGCHTPLSKDDIKNLRALANLADAAPLSAILRERAAKILARLCGLMVSDQSLKPIVDVVSELHRERPTGVYLRSSPGKSPVSVGGLMQQMSEARVINAIKTFAKTLRDACNMLEAEHFPSKVASDPKAYERAAYLSYALALEECSSLDTLAKAYDWVKTNGVEIDGESYKLPPFPTWRKYRNAGERKAKGK